MPADSNENLLLQQVIKSFLVSDVPNDDACNVEYPEGKIAVPSLNQTRIALTVRAACAHYAAFCGSG